jgi:hypothetical protein
MLHKNRNELHNSHYYDYSSQSGIALIDDERAVLIESVKIVTIEMAQYIEEQVTINFSDYLSQKSGND